MRYLLMGCGLFVVVSAQAATFEDQLRSSMVEVVPGPTSAALTSYAAAPPYEEQRFTTTCAAVVDKSPRDVRQMVHIAENYQRDAAPVAAGKLALLKNMRSHVLTKPTVQTVFAFAPPCASRH